MTEKEIVANSFAKNILEYLLKTFESWYADQCHKADHDKLDREAFKYELSKRMKRIYYISSEIEMFNLIAFFDKMSTFNDSQKRKERR
jgi:hypothetical protein